MTYAIILTGWWYVTVGGQILFEKKKVETADTETQV